MALADTLSNDLLIKYADNIRRFGGVASLLVDTKGNIYP